MPSAGNARLACIGLCKKSQHAQWWEARIARQREIDASIAAKADYEFLYDKPYEDKKKTRVAGPFTVESLSPHRVLGVDTDDSLIDPLAEKAGQDSRDFVSMQTLLNSTVYKARIGKFRWKTALTSSSVAMKVLAAYTNTTHKAT